MKIQKTKSAFCILFIFIILTGSLFSQTPYYSLKFDLTDTAKISYMYKIIEDVCQFDYKPVITSGDYWFGKDTSTLSWGSLPDTMYKLLKCKQVAESEGIRYEYGNHQMIWENIFSLTIIRKKANGKRDEPYNYDTMIVVFPVIIKSFVTFIDLGNIVFNKGYYELIDEFIYDTKDWLKITLPKYMEWKSIDFEERKIKTDLTSLPK